MDIRKIDYYDEETVLEATVVSGGGTHKRPIVFIFPAWEGKGAFAEKKAVEMAKLGYIGCALDVYGKNIFGKTKEECESLMTPLFSDRLKLRKRILAYKSLFSSIPEADSHKTAAMGFCFGGLCALDLARSGAPVGGVISVHGLLVPPKFHLHPIHSRVLVLHGYKDPLVSKESLMEFSSEMEKKHVDFQLHVFGKAMHAFTNPEANDPSFGTVYQPEADRRSTKLIQMFLSELF